MQDKSQYLPPFNPILNHKLAMQRTKKEEIEASFFLNLIQSSESSLDSKRNYIYGEVSFELRLEAGERLFGAKQRLFLIERSNLQHES